MRIPKLCRHKSTGRGYATDPATGHEVYFGVHGSAECRAAYDRWLAALLTRRADVASGAAPGSTVTVAALLTDFMAHARGYYKKHGRPTSEAATFRRVLALVEDFFAELPADSFGPTQLKAVRQRLVADGLARTHVNGQVGRVRLAWRWGVEQELVRPQTLVALRAVAPLRRGRTAAPEREPVGPVPPEVVGETVFRAPASLGRMIRLHLLGAMRPEDVCRLRPCDVDTTLDPWLYVPHAHKTEHHGRSRRIWLGPQAREILLAVVTDWHSAAWLFPRRRGPRSPLGHVLPAGYRMLVLGVCARHGLPRWVPRQLRHTALTEIRARYGLEAAQQAAGHARADVTQLYAERDEALARRIAREQG